MGNLRQQLAATEKAMIVTGVKYQNLLRACDDLANEISDHGTISWNSSAWQTVAELIGRLDSAGRTR